MYTLRNLTTASAATVRLLATSGPENSRTLVLVLQQQVQQPRFQSSSAAAAFKVLAKNQNQVISGSTAPAGSQTTGAKGRTLPPYMVFRYCQPAVTGMHQTTQRHSTIAWDANSFEATAEVANEVQTVATRPLVLLFGWMLSKNSHLEKYRQFWTSRGYDILTVQTSPIDLLLPSIGGRKVAINVFNFLSNMTPKYDEILVHAFSVGGYQLGELLQRLYEGIERGEPEAERVYSAMKGWLIDSVVFADDAAPGLSRAITLHPIGQPILEKSIASFLALTKPFTFARYKLVEANIIDNNRHIPATLLFSKDDIVSNWKANYGVVDSWERKGIPTKATCWETSKHVLHYKEHPEEYEQAVDRFVARCDITKAHKRA